MNLELVIFLLMGSVAIAGALAVVFGKNPVYAAMGLMATLFALAVFYVVHLAHFVAAVQIIVYAGAVMTLFLFVIMFVGVDRAEVLDEKLPVQRPMALIVVVGIIVVAGFLVVSDSFSWIVNPGEVEAAPNGTVEEIGSNLIVTQFEDGSYQVTRWLLPFEATGVLLIVAAVGAISLAFYRPRRVEKAKARE